MPTNSNRLHLFCPTQTKYRHSVKYWRPDEEEIRQMLNDFSLDEFEIHHGWRGVRHMLNKMGDIAMPPEFDQPERRAQADKLEPGDYALIIKPITHVSLKSVRECTPDCFDIIAFEVSD